MKKNASENVPSFQFYPMDWLGDVNLRMCSPAARGLWIDLMCIMTRTQTYGYLAIHSEFIGVSSLVKLTGIPFRTLDKLLTELLDNGVARKDEKGIIYSKRMVKDQALRLKRRAAGKLGGNPLLLNQIDNQELNPLVGKNSKQNPTPSSSSSFSSSSSASLLKKDLKHICDFWNSQKIIQHKNSKEITTAITSALKTYTGEEIIEAITSYSEILKHPETYWLTHPWTLITFLTQKRKNSIETFLNINKPLERYKTQHRKTQREINLERMNKDLEEMEATDEKI